MGEELTSLMHLLGVEVFGGVEIGFSTVSAGIRGIIWLLFCLDCFLVELIAHAIFSLLHFLKSVHEYLS